MYVSICLVVSLVCTVASMSEDRLWLVGYQNIEMKIGSGWLVKVKFQKCVILISWLLMKTSPRNGAPSREVLSPCLTAELISYILSSQMDDALKCT